MRNAAGTARQAGRHARRVSLLGKTRGHSRRPLVALAGGSRIPCKLEQVPPHPLEPVGVRHPLISVEGAEHGEPSAWSVHHRDRQCTIQRDHRPGRHALEHLVEGEDLRPVRVLRARRLVVNGRYRRLHLVGTDRRSAQGAGNERDPLADLADVPEVTRLLSERNQGALSRCPGRSAGIGQEHEGEQPNDLALIGQKLAEQARQPDGLGGQVGPVQCRARAGRVPLVEDQIQHVEYDAETVGSLRLRREVESQAGVLDALLGPADPLGHRGFRNQKGAGNLGGGQAPDHPQGESQLRRHRERRVAAQEEERKSVVLVGRLALARQFKSRCGLLPTMPGALAAPCIHQTSGGDGDEPRPRAVRHSRLWPLQRRREQCLLHGVLAGVELTVASHEYAEDLRRELAQQILDAGPVVTPPAARPSPGGPRWVRA
jgi:hypothetical protein